MFYQALRLFDAGSKDNTAYTILRPDRGAHQGLDGQNRSGTGLCQANTEVAKILKVRGCSVTLRWTPAHSGVEGDEVADEYAKVATHFLRNRRGLVHLAAEQGQNMA